LSSRLIRLVDYELVRSQAALIVDTRGRTTPWPIAIVRGKVGREHSPTSMSCCNRTDTRASPIPSMSKAANLSSMRHFCTLSPQLHRSRPGAASIACALLCRLHAACPVSGRSRRCMCSGHSPCQRTELITIDRWSMGTTICVAARDNRTPREFYFTCNLSCSGMYSTTMQASAGLNTWTRISTFLGPFCCRGRIRRECGGIVASSIQRLHAGLRGTAGSMPAGISVSADPEGRRFVGWWRDRCMEWCRLAVEDTPLR